MRGPERRLPLRSRDIAELSRLSSKAALPGISVYPDTDTIGVWPDDDTEYYFKRGTAISRDVG